MDAYAFLAHGHVANAQTGNVVLLAVSAAQADWVEAGRQARTPCYRLLAWGCHG